MANVANVDQPVQMAVTEKTDAMALTAQPGHRGHKVSAGQLGHKACRVSVVNLAPVVM